MGKIFFLVRHTGEERSLESLLLPFPLANRISIPGLPTQPPEEQTMFLANWFLMANGFFLSKAPSQSLRVLSLKSSEI